MNIEIASNRFIGSPLQTAFYKHIAGSILDFYQLGNWLVKYAEQARVYRQVDKVQGASEILLNIPLKEYQTVGQYYLGWCKYRKGSEEVKWILEKAAEETPLTTYRARAMLSLAAVEARKDDITSELYYGLESMKVTSNLTTKLEALKGIAVIKAKEGYHRHALKDLEALVPLARYADPVVYYDYLNSLAVELGEVGRLKEARNISNIVLASPFACAYPEWRETWDDIERKAYRTSHSFVSLTHRASKPNNVLLLPLREQGHRNGSVKYARSPFHQQASVTVLQQWKHKMAEQHNDALKDSDKDNSQYSDKELVLKVMEVVAKRNFSRKKLLEVIEYLEHTPDESSESENPEPKRD